jgi:catechol 2,3-dioxygenase-like lactoylglutathione lyase family enzyme
MIKAIEHIALSVADLDRSLAFYTDLLGLEVIRILECTPDSLLGKVTAMEKCSARIAHLRAGGVMLELFEYISPRGGELAVERRQADIGFIHIGLVSEDVAGDYERLKREGVEFLSEPVEFRPGVWMCYFYGPDGEVCELRKDEQT